MNNNQYRPLHSDRCSGLLRSIRGRLLTCLMAVLGSSAINAQTVTGTPEEFAGQSQPLRVVHILDEPRHRTVYADEDIRLLDIQINPGDTTLPHTHDSAILYTFIRNGEGLLGGRLSSVTDYVAEPFTHRAHNPGPGLFRIIALTTFADPVAPGTHDLPEGLDLTPELENAWFRAYRLTLAAGEQTPVIRHANPAFAIQVSGEGAVRLHRSDGIVEEMLSPGDWSALRPQQDYRLVNSSDLPVTLVINEARP